MSTGLGNPALIAVASSKEGQNAIGQGINALKYVLIIGGTIFASKIAYDQYKKWRAEKYARDNAGDPNLVAAAVIFNSFSRFEFPGVLGFLLPSFEISANERALYDIASQVESVKAVSKAYKILFDRTLFFDVSKGLDTQEMQNFWNIIKAESTNTDTTTQYPIGSTLYVADKSGILVNEAIQDQNGNWSGTNNLYGKYSYKQVVGKVIAIGVFENENYYIVQQIRFSQCLTNCQIGVVLQSQVDNVQPK
ncbi:hypothetical protein [Lacinutrix sp. Hel_I_90]|uniref:hypothetical protein n=1 Tax=Lacinutrix sp. Hel_I_90 TaxID=1249999 RepID=UPI0005C8D248|nr:hypothetical protein [Lacinutrix sp. Hel_I_90]